MENKMYKKSFLDRVRFLARKILKSSAVGRGLYPTIQKVWKLYAVPRNRRRLRKHGFDILKRLHALLTTHAVPYYCDCGTLIGFIRDGGFIPHDDDIDIAIMPDTVKASSVLKLFLDSGYGFVHAFRYADRMIEFTVADYTGTTIDVFCHKWIKDDPGYLEEIFIRWYKNRNYPNERANTGLKFRLRGPEGLKTITVGGVETSVPSNAEEVLDSEYGPWRKPDPNFKSEQIENEELPDFVFRMTESEALAM